MQIISYNIELRGIHIYAYHGVLPQEREVGGWYIIDTNLNINDYNCAYDDDIANTVSYADVYDIIKEEMLQPSNLMENVAKRIIEALFKRFERVEEIEITICKETPPMGGDRLKAGVTLKANR